MDSDLREGLIKDMVESGAIVRLDPIDDLVDAARAAKPDAVIEKGYISTMTIAQLTATEKARKAAERLYKPGEIVVDSRGVDYACCNDGSLRLAGGHLRMKKKERRKMRRALKDAP